LQERLLEIWGRYVTSNEAVDEMDIRRDVGQFGRVSHLSGYVSADSSAFDCDFQMASLPPAVLTTSAPPGPETLHAS
jgi:hypothetical protein